MASLSIEVPALNEERNLPTVFAALPRDAEVILVDGGSVDRTVEVERALRPSVRIIQQTRKGKGHALACGFAAATGEYIVMIDADGSTEPAEIPRFVAALNDGADVRLLPDPLLQRGTREGRDGPAAAWTREPRLGKRLPAGDHPEGDRTRRHRHIDGS
jgi:glycosyltransferase involved in cell wall biosynthesis